MNAPSPTATDVDIVVRGEGEQTMLELASLVSEGKLDNLSGVLGITFKKNGKVCGYSRQTIH